MYINNFLLKRYMGSDPDRRPSKKDKIMKRRYRVYKKGGKYRTWE